MEGGRSFGLSNRTTKLRLALVRAAGKLATLAGYGAGAGAVDLEARGCEERK